MSTMTLKEAKHMLGLADQKNLSSEGANALFQKGLLADLFEAAGKAGNVNRDEFRKLIGLDPMNFEIIVDYSQTLTEMILAGQYDWHNNDITECRFPHQQEGKVTLTPVLVHIDRNASTAEALAEIAKRGLRPATLAELLAFGATYPELQRKFPIVALGQSALIGGYPNVPVLCGDGRERGLDLVWAGLGWNGRCRFLAFAL